MMPNRIAAANEPLVALLQIYPTPTFCVSLCPAIRWSLKSISSNNDVNMKILLSSPYIFANSNSSTTVVLLFFFVRELVRLEILQ